MKPNLRLQRKIMNVIKSTTGGGGNWVVVDILSSGNFTVPDNAIGNTLFVTAIGGGGSGQAVQFYQGGSAFACGGSSGFFVENEPITVVPGQVIPVVIGSGGASAVTSNVVTESGINGGDTSFGTLLVRGGYGGNGQGPVDGGFRSAFVPRVIVLSTGQTQAGPQLPAETNGRYKEGVLSGGNMSGSLFVGGGAPGLFGDGSDSRILLGSSNLTAPSAAANTGAGGGSCGVILPSGGTIRTVTSGAGGSGRVRVMYLSK